MHTIVMKYTYLCRYGTCSNVRYSNFPSVFPLNSVITMPYTQFLKHGIERHDVHFERISVEYDWLGNANRESAFRQ